VTKTFLPLAKSPIATPDLWSKVARNWLATGVIKSYLNELQVYAKSDGIKVYVKSGAANIQAIYFDSDAEEVLAIAAADATNPRIDRVIVRLDLPGDSIDFAILQGVPAVSPTAPALTQNNTRWEISLAQVYVGANVSTIAVGNIADERNFVKNANAIQGKWNDLILQNIWSWNNANGFGKPGYMKDEMGFVHLKGSVGGGTSNQGIIITTLPVGYRPSENLFITIVAYLNSTASLQLSSIYIKTDGTITTDLNCSVNNIPLNMIPPFLAV
jgi:hypothetical protein